MLFQYLVDKNVGQYVDDVERFPRINFYSSDNPAKISNAIIDMYSFSSHLYKLKFISDQLSALQCMAIELRFFDPISYDVLVNSVNSFKDSTIRSVFLTLNYTSWMNDSLMIETLNSTDKLYRIVIFGANENTIHKYTNVKMLIKRTEYFANEMQCGYISPYYFNTSLEFVKESLTFNNCLNKKIAIDKNGLIKNCPAMNTNYGNIEDILLDDVVKRNDFRFIWSLSKGKVVVCKDCEYRYVCQDCRAILSNPLDIFSKPKYCSYDPYSNHW